MYSASRWGERIIKTEEYHLNTMSQLAIASVSPRAIAWLIRPGEWARFEEIVAYNCATLGGYYNVVLPIDEDDTLAEPYVKFLADYDPDLIVLPPGMTSLSLEESQRLIFPFSIIQWEMVGQFITDDPGASGSGTNVPVDYNEALKEDPLRRDPLIAVANENHPDASRLAMVACGDIRPMRPSLMEMDGEIDFNALGYREMFLQRYLKSEHHWHEAGARLQDDEVVDAPDRFHLEAMLANEYKFPLSGATLMLRACCELQHYPTKRSFIGVTAPYKISGRERPDERILQKRPPAVVVLVSDEFDLEEALLFWNIRATDTKAAWLSFSEIVKDADELSRWLDSDYGGAFYSIIDGIRSGFTFSSRKDDLSRLHALLGTLQEKRRRNYPEWAVVDFDELVSYNFSRPHVKKERLSVIEDANECAFVPPFPKQAISGIYGITLEWDRVMLPPSKEVVENLVSAKNVEGAVYIAHQSGGVKAIHTPRFRITKKRRLRAQFNNDSPIEFRRPAAEQVVDVLFTSAGVSRVEPSSVSRYHYEYMRRAGSLEDAAFYLATPPYRELLTLLANNRDNKLPGWILDHPAKRRALHHLHILGVFGEDVPAGTNEYFDTVSDTLPAGAVSLLEKSLIERGFMLKCRVCTFKSWYPAGEVSQTFQCSRCFQPQVYHTNPLWLYKLPEVLFQGFEANMHVPLLALNYLKSISKASCGWAPDSDIYGFEGETKRNVDLLCLSDGSLYAGEAKSNDSIETDQFAFYKDLCKRVQVDGIVFATSQPRWGRGTLERIDQLKADSNKHVIVLTGNELYSLV